MESQQDATRAADTTRAQWTIGVDIGGTFTDAAAVYSDGNLYSAKAPTNPTDPAAGVLMALETLAGDIGLPLDDLLADTWKLAHGTTATLNAMVQRRGARVGLITTKGFRDHLAVMNAQRGRGLHKFERRDLARVMKPEPLVPLELTRDVTERVDYDGRVVVPLVEAEARQALEQLLDAGIETLSVSLLWSFKNPSHEQAIGRIAQELAPGLLVTLSSELAPVIGEYERTFTTVANSFLAPSLASYVLDLKRRLEQRGLRHPYLLMQSFGGLIPATEAPKYAITTLVSGLAGGVIGAQNVGELLGYDNVITADMGGTSFEVGMIHHGQPLIEAHPFAPPLGPHIGRWTLSVPTLDITAIGSGGGSIAWVDDGILRVGPLSAQAEPGPACYGRGGTLPTVTDADLVLGYLNPTQGGTIQLAREAAEAAIRQHLADPLGLSVLEAARGVVDVANSQMADLMRKITIERGYDPREFVMVAFGGAGPVHLGAFGPRMGVTRMLVPGHGLASAFSALGVAMADVRRSYSLSYFTREPYEPAAIGAIYDELEKQATATLIEWGIEPEQMLFLRYAEMRFRGQSRTVTVGWPAGECDEAAVKAGMASFIDAYEANYGQNTAHPEAGSEITTFRLEAIGQVPKPRLKLASRVSADSGRMPRVTSHRDVYFPDQVQSCPTPVFSGHELSTGHEFIGPALVDYLGTTVAIYPGQRARIDELSNVALELVRK